MTQQMKRMRGRMLLKRSTGLQSSPGRVRTASTGSRNKQGSEKRREARRLLVISTVFLGLTLLAGATWGLTASYLSASGTSLSTSETGQSARELCGQYLARNTDPVSPNGPRNPHNARLVASYPSKASHVASAEERRNGHGYRSSFRDRPREEFVALCFFDFDAHRLPEAEMRHDAQQRLEVIVRTDGTRYILRGGRPADIEPGPLAEDR